MSVTRQQVADVVKRHILMTIPRLEESAFSAARTLTELGADSLDRVEIISAAGEELNVVLTRQRLAHAQVQSVDDLVDLLHALTAEAASPH